MVAHHKRIGRKSSRSRRNNSRRLLVDRLEDRRLLAADLFQDPAEDEPATKMGSDFGDYADSRVAIAEATSAQQLQVLSASVVDNAVTSLIFVDENAIGANDGSSWDDAFVDLQDALNAADLSSEADEIRIADGTYHPTQLADRTIAFDLPDNVWLIGGFAGVGAPDPDFRDVDAFPTVLSGDIGIAGSVFDNSYNVLRVNGTTASIDGVTITGGNANGFSFLVNNVGGGVLIDQGVLTIVNSQITGNSSAWAGGGIFGFDGAEIEVVDSTLSGNSSRFGGAVLSDNGILTLSRSTFDQNTAIIDGGGIHSFFSDLTIQESELIDNNARFGRGGGLYLQRGTTALDETTIQGNTAFDGGGIYSSFGDLSIHKTEFVNNSASDDGGGLFANGGTSAIHKSNFVGNSALGFFGDGGGIESLFGDLEVYDSEFIGNSAGRYGGGINLIGGTSTVHRSSLSGNSARDNGGGARFENAISSSVEVIVSNNTANDGGGLEFRGGQSTLSDSTISHNTAVFGGGILSQIFGTLEISRTEVSYNAADGNGGGILNFRNSLSVTESEFLGNEARGLAAAGRGGAIETGGLGSQATVSDSVISQNRAALGGGIQNFESLNVINSEIRDNHVSRSGGGIRSFGANARAAIIDSLISGNSARIVGGGFDNARGLMQILDSSIVKNRANFAGGGIQNFNGILELSNSELRENHADIKGGALHNSNGQVRLIDTIMFQNSATLNGGAIYSFGGSPDVTITGGLMSQNAAGTNGGAIFNTDGQFTVLDVHFARNVAGENGGGIFNDTTGAVEVIGGIFSGNKAEVGSAIYNLGLFLLDDDTVVSQNGLAIFGSVIAT